MDPIANLVEQLLLSQNLRELIDSDTNGENLTDMMITGDKLAELVVALHEWRVGGGYDPYGSFASRHEVQLMARSRGWKG